MKKIILGGFAAFTLALGIALAGPANAVGSVVGDPDDYSGYNYSVELHLTGIPGTPYQAATLGRTVCAKREAGYTEDQLVTYTESMPATSEQAIEVVMGGEYHFCHAYEYDDSIGGGGGSNV